MNRFSMNRKIHNGVSKTHERIPYPFSSSRVSRYCLKQEHSKTPINVFCVTCYEPTCSSCATIITLHGGHEIISFEKGLNDVQEILKKQSIPIREEIGRLNDEISLLEKKRDIERQKLDSISEILEEKDNLTILTLGSSTIKKMNLLLKKVEPSVINFKCNIENSNFERGLFYYLGTNNGKDEKWTNPHTLGNLFYSIQIHKFMNRKSHCFCFKYWGWCY